MHTNKKSEQKKIERQRNEVGRMLAGTLACMSLSFPWTNAFAQSAANLDLSSVERNVSAAEGGQITVGSNVQSVNSGDMLTAAEHVALQQALSGGQTLVISEHGNAIGGNLNLGANLSSLNSLLIPTGVTAIQNSAALSITGNLTNNGTLYAVPTAATALISALNIYNNPGALISSLPPPTSGLTTTSPVSLSLVAINNIVNAGQIISAANLNISAGGSIVNALPQGVTAAAPVMQALNNLNLISGSGQIINSGIMNAITGNVNINSINPANILVNNLGGQILAQLGAINIRDQIFAGKFDSSLNGGSWLSDTLNIWGGTGTASLDISEITGQLNVSAGAASVLADTPDLRLGNMIILGDPTYFNSGNIVIDSNISTTGVALSIVAGGNITSNSGATITTTNPAAAGGNATLVAGVNFTVAGPGTGGANTSSQGAGDIASTLTLTGPSTTGGNIDLSNLSMFSTAAGAPATGGNVTLIAFSPSGTNGSINTSGISYTQTATGLAGNVISVPATAGYQVGQRVLLTQGAGSQVQVITAVTANTSVTVDAVPGFFTGTGTVTTSGIQTSGNNAPSGNVVMIAGATSGTAINAGDIFTAGSQAANGGLINLLVASPAINSATPITITNGAVTVGDIITASSSTATNAASISVGNLSTNGAPVTIVSGSTVTLNGLITTGGNPSVGAIGPGGQLAIFAPGNISSGSTTAGINTSGSTLSISGANVLLLAGSALTTNYSHTFGTTDLLNLTVSTGAASGGGSIDLTGGGSFNAGTFTTKGNQTPSGGTYGGNVQLVSLSGNVLFPSTLTMTTAGLSNGNAIGATANQNGNVTILAGATSGTSINIGNINTTGSNAGAGNITIATTQASLNQGGTQYSYQVVSNNTSIVTTGAISIPVNGAGQTILQAASVTVGNLSAAGGSVPIQPVGNTQSTLTTTISVQSGSGLSIGSVTNLNNTLPAGIFPGGSGCSGCMGISASTIDLYAPNGTLNFSGSPSSISASATTPNPTFNLGVDGGTINITGQSISGNAAISADGTNGYEPGSGMGGNGGFISITSTGTSSDLTIGASNLSVSALGGNGGGQPGGNGGNISLSSGRDISLTIGAGPIFFQANPQAGSNRLFTPPNFLNAFVSSGRGAVININAGRNLFVNGNLNADGAASGSGNPGGPGGVININVNSTSVFEIGAAAAVTNGIQGNLTANGSPGASPELGDGGSISVTNAGTGGIQIDAGNPLQVTAAAAVGIYPAGNGGNISLTGNTVLSQGTLDASGGGSSATFGSGNGGSITIAITGATAPTFIVGTPAGNGITGSITANGLVVGGGSPPPGPAAVPVWPIGRGGTISISSVSSGGITVDNTGSLSVTAGQANNQNAGGSGGTIILNAPNGPVLVQQATALSVEGGAPSTATDSDGGPGGFISITSKDPTNPFIVGAGATTSGVTTSISANGYSGGEVTINSLGPGGIQVGTGTVTASALSPLNNTQYGGNGGSITLNAANGPLAVNGDLNVSGASGAAPISGFNFGGFGGVINLTTNSALAANNPFTLGSQPVGSNNYVSGNLIANGGFGIAGNGFGGRITINNLAGSVSVGNSNNIQVTAPDATMSGYAGDGGHISISANGTITAPALSANGGAGSIAATPHYARGFAGSISLTTNSATALHLGGTGTGSVSSVSANGWNGGSITLINQGGAVTVEQNSISVTAQAADYSVSPQDVLQFGHRNLGGPGGTVTISAPIGMVTLNGDINVLGGAIFEQLATNLTPIPAGTTTLTVGSTQGFAIGQEVLITNGTNSEWRTITGLAPGASITVAALTNAYATTPTVSAYFLEQTSSTPMSISTQVTSTNPSIPSGATTIDVTDSTGFQPNQQVYIYNSAFQQDTILFTQPITNALPIGPATGTTLNVANTSGFNVGQSVVISGAGESIPGGETKTLVAPITLNTSITINSALAGNYPNQPNATIVYNAGTTILDVADTSGFAAGQIITIVGSGAPANTETATILSVSSNTITLTAGLANTYSGAPTVSSSSVSQTMTIQSLPSGTQMQFTGAVTNLYQQPVTVAAVNHIFTVPQSQGFVVNQALSVSSGSTFEYQFVTGVDSPTANTVTVPQLLNNYPSGATLRVGSLAGQVTITAGQGITQAAGTTIRANSANLSSLGAAGIGTATNPLQVNLQPSIDPGTLTVISPAGQAYINNTSSDLAINSINALAFAITSNGNISVNGPILSTGGATSSLTNTNATAGNININNLPFNPTTANTLNATGAFLFQNDNLAGTFNIQDNVTITSNGLTFTNGPAPLTPTAGTLPANVTVVPTGSPSVFFGNGLTAAGPLTLNVGTNAGNIVFNGTNASSINFAGGTTTINSINRTQALPPTSTPPPLTSTPSSPGFFVPLSIFAIGSNRPFGTIVASDQTPESNPEQSIESNSLNSTSLLSAAAANALKGQLFYMDRGLPVLNGDDSPISLALGGTLVFASKNTQIQNGIANIDIKQGSAVMILNTGSELAILNMHDETRGAVKATVNGTTFDVPVGRQMTISTKQNPQFDKINPSSIGYRELSSAKHGDKHVFFAEFSPLSALTSVAKWLSPEDKYHQMIAKRMLKTAAAIYVLGQQTKKAGFKASQANQ